MLFLRKVNPFSDRAHDFLNLKQKNRRAVSLGSALPAQGQDHLAALPGSNSGRGGESLCRAPESLHMSLLTLELRSLRGQ